MGKYNRNNRAEDGEMQMYGDESREEKIRGDYDELGKL